ncbi:MAG: DeoR/GlpR family DNA-binding transcription regulator [Propionicimonas sp.]
MTKNERAALPDDTAVPAGRRAQIAAYVQAAGPASVRTLAARFQVSRDTIRRDLDQLSAEGRVVRTHGGAIDIAANRRDAGPAPYEAMFSPAKAEVGSLAASLVPDGGVIMVNAGATGVAMARGLQGKRDLTVVTNNLLVPPALPVGACRFVYVLGGEVRLTGQSTIGSVPRQLADSSLDLRCDLALISIGGVTVERGYSTGDLAEAVMMHEMMARATKVAILADSSKFGRQLFANIAEIGEADYFVTNEPPPAELAKALASGGVEVLIPKRD